MLSTVLTFVGASRTDSSGDKDNSLSDIEGGIDFKTKLNTERNGLEGEYLRSSSSSTYGPVDEGETEQFRGAEELLRMENSFEDILSSNRLFIEGMRGIFTFLVLYDHFHNPKRAISSSFTADTYLFIMISGFTTALQLRESPRFIDLGSHSGINNNNNNNNNNNFEKSDKIPLRKKELGGESIFNISSKISGKSSGKNNEDDNDNLGLFESMDPESASEGYFRVTRKNGINHGLVLAPRKSFKVLPFIMSRCVGLLPILWLALLLNIPPWIGDSVNAKLEVEIGCSAMYVVAMQSWWRPACHYYGPNNTLYASILLNCFIIYSIGRLLIITVQDYLMTWSSDELSPVTLKPPRRMLRSRTWKQFIGDKMVALSFNRTDMPTMLVMLVFWIGASLGFFTLMLYFTFAKVRRD